jgi:hypothetical protein
MRAFQFSANYRLFYLVLVVGFIATSIWLNSRAAFGFPIPWPDESIFIYPAISFSETASLFAPELHPERDLLWMPPTYALVMATLFKTIGFSLGIARASSLAFILVAFFVLLAMMRRYDGGSYVMLLITALIFLSPPFVAAGNVARMDALLLLVICVAFLFLQQGDVWKALSLLAFSPLIHPNGFYFALSGAGYTVVQTWNQVIISRAAVELRHIEPTEDKLKFQFTKFDFILISLVLTAWLGYGIYVALHWDSFLNDMAFQFQRKGDRDILASLSLRRTALLLVVLALAAYAAYQKMNIQFLVWLAIPAWIIKKIGLEMWYGIYDLIFYIIVSALVFAIAKDIADRYLTTEIWRDLTLTITVILLCLWHFGSDRIISPFDASYQEVKIGRWYAVDDPPYWTDEDRAAVQNFLQESLKSKKPLAVQFHPEADAMLFNQLRPEGITFSQQYFSERKPDVYVIHLSKYMPDFWAKTNAAIFSEIGLDTAIRAASYMRNGTEKWYFLNRK